MFDSYDKPIVLIGLSSSPANDELGRLASSLSRSLAGDSDGRAKAVRDAIGRSAGAALLGDDAGGGGGGGGIALSAVGSDDEYGPYVLDPDLAGQLVRDGTLGLGTGVLVLDFNHAAFAGGGEGASDLAEALSDLAERLYGDEGLLSVYVNVDPSSMDEAAKKRKEELESKVLIPRSDYEVCVRDEGATGSSSGSWGDIEWELRRMVGRALLPPPVVGGSSGPNSADLMMGMNTFFLSLSFPEVEDAAPYVERMCEDVDSMVSSRPNSSGTR